MNTTDYWPMAREYSVWNAAVAAVQFWTADCEPHIFGSTINQVFHAFFYSTSTHILHQQSDQILFGHFVTMLNATFESRLALEDKGYQSCSESFNIPTPLQKNIQDSPCFQHQKASFDPVPVTPHSTRDPRIRPVCRRLTYSPLDDDDTTEDEVPSPFSASQVQNHTHDA